jgi:hypothetical protein
MTASSDDPRNIVTGWEIPTATYSDQPYIVKSPTENLGFNDGEWFPVQLMNVKELLRLSRSLAAASPGVETSRLIPPQTCCKQVTARARVCFSTLWLYQTPISIGDGVAAKIAGLPDYSLNVHKLEGSRYRVPDGPGLGVEFNEARAQGQTFKFWEAPHLHRRDGSHTNW